MSVLRRSYVFKKRTGVLVAGLALFSMFFGAGDIVLPLILGGGAGDKNIYALAGLLVAGVGLPLLGLLSMMLFQGDYHSFFNRIGKRGGAILILIIQGVVGPFGAIPRLITLSFTNLKPYMPEMLSLALFSLLSCFLIYFFVRKRHRVVDLLGLVLTPILLLSVGAIIYLGLYHHPSAHVVEMTNQVALMRGLHTGYSTLDLIVSFLFAPLVLSYFCVEENAPSDPLIARRQVFKKMVKACLFAAFLLGSMYTGLTFVASYYAPLLPIATPEEMLPAISIYLLGSKGALLSSIGVTLASLTSAIPVTVISAQYVHKNFLKERVNYLTATVIVLGLSGAIACLGFMGITNMLGPVLQLICPGLIILAVLNILYKLFEMRTIKIPVYLAFGTSIASYVIHLV